MPTCIHAYMHACIKADMHAYIHAYIQIYIYTYVHTYIYSREPTAALSLHILACVYVCMYGNAHLLHP